MDRTRYPLWAGLLCLLGVLSPALAQVTLVSSASFAEEVAPGSLATVFVAGATDEEVQATPGPAGRLPTELGGVTVDVDGRRAGIWYASPTQINLVVPLETATGAVPVTVSSVAKGVAASGTATVRIAAPGLFSLDGSGTGPGAILNGVTYLGGPFFILTVENADCDKRTRLAAFATGIRNAGTVQLTIEDAGGAVTSVDAEFAGGTEAFLGLDQVNFPLASDLDGGGMESNAVAFTVGTFDGEPPMCVNGGRMLSYNTVADLLAGDLWDVASPAQVASDLLTVPGDWSIMGVGTTAEMAHNGEVIAFGTAMAPELVWSDPAFPPTVRLLSSEAIPFLGVAAGNPAEVITAEAEAGLPIHQQVVEFAQASGLAFAGVRVSGRVSDVNYSVAHNLLKEGTPLTDPTVDKAPYQLFFTVDDDVMWELSGFYAAAAAVQGIVSVPGAPVHLHGFQLDRSRAGHVGSAIAKQVEIRLYPLGAPEVRGSDLTLRNVTANTGALAFEVVNQVANTVAYATVQVLTGEAIVAQAQLSSLRSGEPQFISTSMPTSVDVDALKLVVDPFNDVLEFDEANNTVLCPCGTAP
jgi:uncharacterized protein (TIGR03437 family)